MARSTARSTAIIREATREDASAIGEMHEAAWLAGYSHIFEPDVLANAAARRRTRWIASFDDPSFSETTLLVADRDDSIAAFAHFSPTTHPPSRDGVAPRGDKHIQVGWIHSFYVHPDHWGSGLAQQLMEAVLDRMAVDEQTNAGLTTFAQSTRARRFYEKMGFSLTGQTSHAPVPGAPPVPQVEYSQVLVRSARAGEVAAD